MFYICNLGITLYLKDMFELTQSQKTLRKLPFCQVNSIRIDSSMLRAGPACCTSMNEYTLQKRSNSGLLFLYWYILK